MKCFCGFLALGLLMAGAGRAKADFIVAASYAVGQEPWAMATVNQRYTAEERLLILYFRWQFLSLAVRRLLGVGEKEAALRLTSVLQYFANVLGRRVTNVRFGNLTAADYLLLNS